MNPILTPQQQETIKKKIRWHQKRLQQFADRSGLSLLQVEILLEDPARAPSLDSQIDRTVDIEFKNTNKPL